MNSVLSVEIIQSSHNLTVDESGVPAVPTVSGAKDPFQDFSCVFEKLDVEAALDSLSM